MNIVKRGGKTEELKRYKIALAIQKAFKSCGTYNEKTRLDILDMASTLPVWEGITVEEIQDEVEETLMDYGYNQEAKEYILYRKERAIERAKRDKLTSAIYSKLQGSDIENQNANVDESSFGGRLGEASRVVTKHYALYYYMSEMSRENHVNNEIYIHDLDSYALGMHNCLSLPIDDLLKNGYKVRQCDIRPANSVSTAFQLLAVYFQVQSLQQFGGVSATHLDWSMVPYVRKSFYKHWKDGIKYILERSIEDPDIVPEELSIDDTFYKKYTTKVYNYALDMTTKEISQAVEGMYHNLNSLQSRSGQQLPFSSINYGTCTLIEGRMVIKALLEGSIKGVGKYHRTPIFPCGIWQYMKGVNDKPGTPNYDLYKLALESTAKRIYPNYVNVDWSVNAGYNPKDPRTYTSTMGL